MTAFQRTGLEKLLTLSLIVQLKRLQGQSQHTWKAPLKTRTVTADSFNIENLYLLEKKKTKQKPKL